MHVPNFGGCQGRRTDVGVTTVSNLLILGGRMTKVFKKMAEKNRGGRVADNNILTFLCYWLDKKNATFKNYILGNLFYSYL